MSYLIGLGLALAVVLFGWRSGFDRDRSFYPTMLIVVASYYVLFAAIGEQHAGLAVECLVMAVFVVAAVAGHRVSPWIVVAGLVGHGLFDAVREHFLSNSYVPAGWPGFCLGFDVVAGGGLAWVSMRRTRSARHLT